MITMLILAASVKSLRAFGHVCEMAIIDAVESFRVLAFGQLC